MGCCLIFDNIYPRHIIYINNANADDCAMDVISCGNLCTPAARTGRRKNEKLCCLKNFMKGGAIISSSHCIACVRVPKEPNQSFMKEYEIYGEAV